MTKDDALQLANKAAPAVVDLTTVLLYGTATAWFQNIFASKTMFGLWIILGLFVLLTAATHLLNRLALGERTKTHSLFVYPAIGFAAVMLMMMFEAGGILSSPDRLDDPVMGVVLLLFMAVLVAFLVFTFAQSDKRLAPNTFAYFFAQLFALAAIAGIILLSGAYWEYTFFESGEPVSIGLRFAHMLWAYPLFFFFFAGPRLLPLAKRFTRVSFISALISIGYYVWHSMSMMAF